MKLIAPYAVVLTGLKEKDVLQQIEYAGRICYKSTGSIDEYSAAPFVGRLIKNGHEAMLEHASIALQVSEGLYHDLLLESNYMESVGIPSFLHFTDRKHRHIVSGNIRAWRTYFSHASPLLPYELYHIVKAYPVLFPEWQDFKYFDGESYEEFATEMEDDELEGTIEKLVHQTISVLFTVDRGISHELVRHRPASFAQESTRYCNYSKDKFGSELTFIMPPFRADTEEFQIWEAQMQQVERDYMHMVKDLGTPPELARTILPNSLKTTLVMTANLAEWKHFFDLRAMNLTGKAHPQMQEIARALLKRFGQLWPEIFGAGAGYDF